MSKYDLVPPSGKSEIGNNESSETIVVKYAEPRNVINDTNAEIDVLKRAFKSPLDIEREKKEKNINPNFWFAVYFQDEDQKEEFIKKAGLEQETKGLYIDGLSFAKSLGISIARKDNPPPAKFKSFKQ